MSANPPSMTTAPERRSWRWQEWTAVIASLVIGVMLGPFVLRASQPLPFMSAAGRVVAIGKLEEALLKQAAGAVDGNDSIAIGMSFRDTDGYYCRTFAINPGPAGLACREWGEWVVEVLARNPRARQGPPNETYRQAGTPFPPAVRSAVDARIKGEPMTTEEEAEANTRGWRRPD
jgi:hypothetical protein